MAADGIKGITVQALNFPWKWKQKYIWLRSEEMCDEETNK